MLKFLAFSDIHGNTESVKKLIPTVKNEQFDGILFAGDFTNAFLDRDLEKANDKYQIIMKLLQSLETPVYYVLGNRDFVPKVDGIKVINANLPYNLSKEKKIYITKKISIASDHRLVDGNTIYLTHFNNKLQAKALLHVAGHVHWGVKYRNYLNLGFLYRDKEHGAPALEGCYWDIIIDNNKVTNVMWHNLGGMKETKCNNHPFAIFYIPHYWKKCPLCYQNERVGWKIFSKDMESLSSKSSRFNDFF